MKLLNRLCLLQLACGSPGKNLNSIESLTMLELDWEDRWLSHFCSQAAENTEVESRIAWGCVGPHVENWLGSDKSGDR